MILGCKTLKKELLRCKKTILQIKLWSYAWFPINKRILIDKKKTTKTVHIEKID